MNSYLIMLLLVSTMEYGEPPTLPDKESFDNCVTEVNANPNKGSDSDYLHCEEQFDPKGELYPEERGVEDDRADYMAINHAENEQ